MHYVKQFHINGVDTKQVACIELHGKPNAATEGYVGVLGIDMASPLHDVYKCVAVNGSIYTWDLLSSGLSIMSATINGEGAESVQFPYESLNKPETYVVKIGDLILDRKGYLYQINSLNSTYCTATYSGTQIIAEGDSAYEVAVKNGFEGTVTEWLATLKGETGDSGVHLGSEEPTDPDMNVWVDPFGENDSPVAAQSDYEQNDPTQPDYIKNRPFYAISSFQEVIAPISLSFVWEEEMSSFIYFSTLTAELSELWFSDWSVAKIVWNGVEYICKPQVIDGMKAIGNANALIPDYFEDTGEPFVMTMEGEETIVIIDLSTPVTEGTEVGASINHTVGLSIGSEEVKKLDSKFIDFEPIATYIDNYINEALGGDY